MADLKSKMAAVHNLLCKSDHVENRFQFSSTQVQMQRLHALKNLQFQTFKNKQAKRSVFFWKIFENIILDNGVEFADQLGSRVNQGRLISGMFYQKSNNNDAEENLLDITHNVKQILEEDYSHGKQSSSIMQQQSGYRNVNKRTTFKRNFGQSNLLKVFTSLYCVFL